MRPLFAWLLLFTIVFQQMVGKVYVQIIYSVEIESKMTEKETQIAEALKERSGIDAHVTSNSEDHLMQRMGYGAPFIFSEEINGETYCFTVEREPVMVTHHVEITPPLENNERFPTSRILLAKMFSDFCFDDSNLFFVTSPPAYAVVVFAISDMIMNFHPPVPAPPPWQA
jgi:hypothetical protein